MMNTEAAISSFILHPSSFILHPSSFILQASAEQGTSNATGFRTKGFRRREIGARAVGMRIVVIRENRTPLPTFLRIGIHRPHAVPM